MKKVTVLYSIFIALAIGAFVYFKVINPASGDITMLTITSPAFSENQEIPALYTCQGQDTSPLLHIHGIPHKTKSLALIVDDPDAPNPESPELTWVHWVVYNLPADALEIPAGFGKQKSISSAFPSAHEGLTNWNTPHFGGPCPPIGSHRYYFKIYALDTLLSFPNTPTKDQLLQAMEDHVLAQGQLIGIYAKKP